MDSVFGVESPAYVAIRALLSALSLGLIGGIVLHGVVLRRLRDPGADELRRALRARLPRGIVVLACLAIVGTLARLAAQHAAVFGGDVSPTADSLHALLVRSSWGRSWWLALMAAIAVAVAGMRHLRGRAEWIALTAGALGFVVSQPWSGHPAATDSPLLSIGTQTLHILGAGAWLGTLATLAGLAIPAARHCAQPHTLIAALVRAFSPVALTAAALVVASGAITAWENLGALSALWSSAYGRTLSLKLGALAVTAAVGAYNWRRVLPRLGEAEASDSLRRAMRVELASAALAVLVTAVLVATPMPGE